MSGIRARPIGTFSQKIHCQARPWTTIPPTTGPPRMARPVIPANSPMALPRVSGGNAADNSASACGSTMAVPIPCAARAAISTPPFGEWFLGRDAIGEFMATGFARGGSFRFVPTRANGQPALALYSRRNSDVYRFRQVQVLTMTETGIAQIDGFHADGLYAHFGLPAVLAD